MSRSVSVVVVSDIHYAGDAEKARGHPREGLTTNPVLNLLMAAWDRLIWMRDPLAHNHLVDHFITDAADADLVVANGDFSCDSASVGMSDDAAFSSASECLGKLRAGFGPCLLATIGDHELGKTSFVGGKGGMRLASWPRSVEGLGLKPFWRHEVGNYVLIGVTSSLVGLDVLRPDALPEELGEWEKLRAAHLAEVDAAFAALEPRQRVLLFCHDPSALPFLLDVPNVYARLGQIERTIVGHLHSGLIFWKSQRLAGMPRISFLGSTLRRWTAALNRAKHWRPFHTTLCPALAGIELNKRGGWLVAKLDPTAQRPAELRVHTLKR
ncbi:MAG TPA: hypothetical protein VI454_10985 [Verrucomicrobiae bacterium]